MNRQPRALLSVLLIGAIAFVGWRWWTGTRPDADGGVEIAISETSTRGGSITSSMRTEPRTFNRMVSAGVPTDLYSILTTSKLVRVNRASHELEAGVAEKWTISPDNLTWTLTLRDGVVWSDGTPFTSADVVFSFQAVYDPKVESGMAGSLMIGGKPLQVSAPDARTVVIKLPGTFGPGLIAGGALTGVFVAILAVVTPDAIGALNLEHSVVDGIGAGTYGFMGVLFFVTMCAMLYRTAVKK